MHGVVWWSIVLMRSIADRPADWLGGWMMAAVWHALTVIAPLISASVHQLACVACSALVEQALCSVCIEDQPLPTHSWCVTPY
jgi:hypothetical protein